MAASFSGVRGMFQNRTEVRRNFKDLLGHPETMFANGQNPLVWAKTTPTGSRAPTVEELVLTVEWIWRCIKTGWANTGILKPTSGSAVMRVPLTQNRFSSAIIEVFYAFGITGSSCATTR